MKWYKWGHVNSGEYWRFEISLNDAVDILGVERVHATIKESPLSKTFDANVGLSGKYRQGIYALRKTRKV